MIHIPASAVIANAPVTAVHTYLSPLTGLARRKLLRLAAVLLGHPLPPRYSHSSHNTTNSTGRHHGNEGVVFRLLKISAPQIAPAAAIMNKASKPYATNKTVFRTIVSS